MHTIEDLLRVPGSRVLLHERGPNAPSAFAKHVASIAPWIDLHPEPSSSHVLTLRGSRPHGRIEFIGEMRNRMVEPLVLAIHALGTGRVDLDTPATPAFLSELTREVFLRVAVSVSCPFCPAASAVALRLACSSPRVHVTIIRADEPSAPRVHAVPTILDDAGIVTSGVVQEMALVEQVMARAARRP